MDVSVFPTYVCGATIVCSRWNLKGGMTRIGSILYIIAAQLGHIIGLARIHGESTLVEPKCALFLCFSNCEGADRTTNLASLKENEIRERNGREQWLDQALIP
jgi:hypothetical protein